MVDIMDHLNQYVPTEVTHTTVQIPGRAPKRMQIDIMHKVQRWRSADGCKNKKRKTHV